MIKKNNLAMKALQAQIEAMQAQNIAPKPSIVARISKMAGTPFMFIISTLLAYGHKLPIISKIINILSLWYGKTAWWRVLVNLRKAFMVFNALIGVCTVLNLSGFNIENFLASCYMLGLTYFEMFTYGVSRIFTWFYNLFDKITPNPSVPNNSSPKFLKLPSFNTSEIPKMPDYPNPAKGPTSVGWSVTDFLKPKEPEPTGWSIPSWVWYVGAAALTIGAVYLGYQVITSEQFRDWLAPHHTNTRSFNPNLPPTDPAGVPLPSSIPSSPNTPSTGILSTIGKKFYSINKSITDALNPFNYFGTKRDHEAALEALLHKQSTPKDLDLSLYPYTENNPLDSYLKRWLTSYYGETKADYDYRMSLKNIVDHWYEEVRVHNRFEPDSSFTYTETPANYQPDSSFILTETPSIYQPGPGTINPGDVGIVQNYRGTQTSYYEAVQQAQYNLQLNRLRGSIAPTTIPGVDVTEEWRTHSRGPSIDIGDIPTASSSSI